MAGNISPNTYKDFEWLRHYYIDLDMSEAEIAKIAKCSHSTIGRWLQRFSIQTHKGNSLKGKKNPRWSGGPQKRICEVCGTVFYTKASYIKKRHVRFCSSKCCGVFNTQNLKQVWASGGFDKAHRSEEAHQRQVRNIKMQWQRGDFDYVHSQENRERCSKHAKRLWETGVIDRQEVSNRSKALWEMGVLSREETSRRTTNMWRDGTLAKYLALRPPTKTEALTIIGLEESHLQHIPQYHPDDCTFVYDELVPPNILIEVHGDNGHSQKRVIRQDKRKEQWACEHDFYYIVFWEHEIYEHGANLLVGERVLPLLCSIG